MPGVLIIETLAQVAAVAILSLPQNSGRIGFLGSVNKARFHRQVTPGDVLTLESRIVRVRGDFAFVEGVARVDDEVAATVDACAGAWPRAGVARDGASMAGACGNLASDGSC